MRARDIDDRADRYARRGHVDQQERDAFLFLALGRGPHQGEHHIGVLGVAGPNLGTVDDILVAVADRHGAERRQIGAGAGFRITLAPEILATQDTRQVVGFLLRRAVADQHRAAHLKAHRDQ